MSDAKRPDPKRRTPTSRPAAGGRSGASGRGSARKPAARSPGSSARKDTQSTAKPVTKPGADTAKPVEERAKPQVIEPIRQAIAESADQQSEQRLGFTARRAAILAAVICVLTLTIAGPVRTYFEQRTEMKQQAALETLLREQIAELEEQKAKLADPAFIAAQARERLGFVMPGDVPYRVQLPPGAIPEERPDDAAVPLQNNDPWYTSLWKTIADEPHGPPEPTPQPGLPATPGEVPPPPPEGPPPDDIPPNP